MNNTSRKITIIGAGLAGSFLAIALAKKGFTVSVYNSRPDPRTIPADEGRSFNLTLYYRGLKAIRALGLFDEIKKVCIQVTGNVAHYDTFARFDPYETSGKEVLYTVHRRSLNNTLITEAERYKQVHFHFNEKLLTIDKQSKKAVIENQKTKKRQTVDASVIFGCDGVHSVVRSEIQEGMTDTLSKEYSDWGYKEVTISPEDAKKLELREHATHTWPRPKSLFIAFPNPDQSFTLMINLPLRGENSFESLANEEKVKEYILGNFPEFSLFLPQVIHAVLKKPLGNFITVLTKPWYHKDFLVILGDAAHGVLPFYGQGMCAAFEDVLTLVDLMEKQNNDFAKVFAEFQTIRKRNTDVLAELSKANFVELRDKSRSAYYLLRDKVESYLHQKFPRLVLPPLYKMIAHDDKPYADAYEAYVAQQKKARVLGISFGVALFSIPLFLTQLFRNKKL